MEKEDIENSIGFHLWNEEVILIFPEKDKDKISIMLKDVPAPLTNDITYLSY